MSLTQSKGVRATILSWTTGIVAFVGALSALIVIIALLRTGSLPDRWLTQLAVFGAVATLPQWFINRISRAGEIVAKDDLPRDVGKRGFENLGAWVGVIERPLLLGALVGRFPEFVAGWYVLKGIAGYRLGLDDKQLTERRLFQLFLLNNALSFAGAALGWLVWGLLRLPTQ